MDAVGKGRPLEPDAHEALHRLLGVRVSLEGLSRLFAPGFPGIRTFAIQVRVAPDAAVELTLVGVARDGTPVWSGTRAFAFGRDGSLEIHRGFDEIDPAYQSRNITVDLMQRELDLLALIDRGHTLGHSSRLTIDADEVGRYVCALHGFSFADETDEGPPVRSVRALDPQGDRARLIAAAPAFVDRIASQANAGRIAIESAIAQLKAAQTPWDFARARLPGHEPELAEGDDGEMGVGSLGRAFLLAHDTPGWRAALYLYDDDKLENRRIGFEYRRRKTNRSEARLAREIQECREALVGSNRVARLRAIETLEMIAPPWIISELRGIAEGDDRRATAIARRAVARINGTALPDDLLAFAQEKKNDPARRALAYRALAEHFPSHVAPHVPMLRVDPDARIQRAAIPLLDRNSIDAGPDLASLLAANPWHEGEMARTGLLALRLELIERLARLLDPRTLPVLIAAYRTHPAPSPAEMLALSRALVGFPDPRAQRALMDVARRFERPQIP
jgi:hypothetical protein